LCGALAECADGGASVRAGSHCLCVVCGNHRFELLHDLSHASAMSHQEFVKELGINYIVATEAGCQQAFFFNVSAFLRRKEHVPTHAFSRNAQKRILPLLGVFILVSQACFERGYDTKESRSILL
jgi:hypothetical protein